MKTAIGTTTALPAQDLERARSFYADVLGLDPPEEMHEDGLRYRVGATEFLVFASSGASSGTHTQMSFRVDDVDEAAADLRSRGVVFDEIEGLDQVDGIAEVPDGRGGWFRDSEGNLLGIIQEGATP
jgi:predicted enzyme related to lactoylglutathione lyase